MKRVILVAIVSLGICSSGHSQRLTNNQKEKIISEITVLFDKSVKFAENLDANGLNSVVNDTLKAGFIDNGNFINSFDEVMKGFRESIRGCKSQKFDISNKKITVLSDNSALVTANGNFSLALEDGRTITGGFAWTLVYSKINGDWKIIHTHVKPQIENKIK